MTSFDFLPGCQEPLPDTTGLSMFGHEMVSHRYANAGQAVTSLLMSYATDPKGKGWDEVRTIINLKKFFKDAETTSA